MVEIILVCMSALWFGILTSISPCPLATNIAAISFLSKKINHSKLVLWSSVAYILGRMIAYAILGVVIIASLVNVPAIANFLQEYMNKILGPILIITGLFLLDVIKVNVSVFSISHKRQTMLAESGAMGAFLLGAIFALSFCPIAAALFFGSLIPLALKSNYGIVLPLIYGIGTGMPVAVFAIGITLSVQSLSRWFHRFAEFEVYTRKITGAVFILAGLYFAWCYIVAPLVS